MNNKLPPSAASLLAQARAEDRAHRVDVERSLAALSASLPFADGAPQASFDTEPLQQGLQSTLDVTQASGALLAGKTLKLVVATVALGGALGGGAWLGRTPAPRAATTPRAAVERTVSGPSDAPRSVPAAEAPPPREVAAAQRAEDARRAEPIAGPANTQNPRRAQAPAQRAIPGSSTRAPASADTRTTAPSPAPAQDTPAREEIAPSKASVSPKELDLIDGALTSLRVGAAEAALARLEQHERLYAQGTFAVERRGLRVLALCQLGRDDQAQRERATFLASHPGAPIAARVRQACGREGGR